MTPWLYPSKKSPKAVKKFNALITVCPEKFLQAGILKNITVFPL
jgi:hypothetical protein